MKLLEQPALDAVDVFDRCMTGISDEVLRNRYANARTTLMHRFAEYEIKARYSQVFSIQACRHGNEGQKIAIDVTKGELTELYTSYFAKDESVGRHFYDAIKIRAPLGKCPYCRFGHVSTLDHFLPKARYPALSVLPSNLIPSCSDCNKGKGSSVVTEALLGLHPYFEKPEIENDTWLYAEVIHTVPLSISFNILAPVGWSVPQKERLANYFRDFKLDARFSVEAASELAGLIEVLDDLQVSQDRADHLSRIARVERRSRANTWKAALYDALKSDDLYINGAYKLARKI